MKRKFLGQDAPGRHWTDRRRAADAPMEIMPDEASVWAAGWNAAVQAYYNSKPTTEVS